MTLTHAIETLEFLNLNPLLRDTLAHLSEILVVFPGIADPKSQYPEFLKDRYQGLRQQVPRYITNHFLVQCYYGEWL